MADLDRTVIAAILAKRELVAMAEEEAGRLRKEYGKALAEARTKGWSTRKLAEELGVSNTRVQQLIEWSR